MVQVFDLESGERLRDLKHKMVYGLSYSSDGRQLATAGWDERIRFWDAQSLDEKSTLEMSSVAQKGHLNIHEILSDAKALVISVVGAVQEHDDVGILGLSRGFDG